MVVTLHPKSTLKKNKRVDDEDDDDAPLVPKKKFKTKRARHGEEDGSSADDSAFGPRIAPDGKNFLLLLLRCIN